MNPSSHVFLLHGTKKNEENLATVKKILGCKK
jgi:hypothetical protein